MVLLSGLSGFWVLFSTEEQKESIEEVKLCGGTVLPPSIEEVKLDSLDISSVASPPSQVLDSGESGDVDVVASLSPESDMHVISIGDVVDKPTVLAPASGAIIAREVCDFLATLVAVYPGTKKRGALGKASAGA